MTHVREDVLSLFVAPAAGAGMLAAWLAPRIATDRPSTYHQEADPPRPPAS